MIETFEYDTENDEFKVIASRRDGTFTVLPLVDRGFVKEATVYVHVRRLIQNASLETPYSYMNYKLPIKYTIKDDAKHYYLKVVERAFDNVSKLTTKPRLINLFIRDFEDGSTVAVPLPSKFYKDEFASGLKIEKLQSTIITDKEVFALLRSKTCIGSYDDSLTIRY